MNYKHQKMCHQSFRRISPFFGASSKDPKQKNGNPFGGQPILLGFQQPQRLWEFSARWHFYHQRRAILRITNEGESKLYQHRPQIAKTNFCVIKGTTSTPSKLVVTHPSTIAHYNCTQQWHHAHSPKVGRHPPHHSTLQWHPAMDPAMAPRPLNHSTLQWHPAIASSNGTPSTPSKLVVTLLPNHSTLQWHPTMAPSNGTRSTAPCNGTLVPRPMRQSGSSPSPLLEVRTPIAIAIWGKIGDDLFMESWKQVHQWIKLIKPLTRCGKSSIETVAGCRQLMLLLEKLCWPAATGKTWDFGGHLWVRNFLGIYDTKHQPYQKRLWDSWKASCKKPFHQLNEPKTSRPIFLLVQQTHITYIHSSNSWLW